MKSLEKVLDCRRHHWEQPQDIAKRYDELYPPKWYEFFRRWCLSGVSDSPSVMLHFELGFLRDHGFLDFKIEGNETVIAPDGKSYSFKLILVQIKAWWTKSSKGDKDIISSTATNLKRVTLTRDPRFI